MQQLKHMTYIVQDGDVLLYAPILHFNKYQTVSDQLLFVLQSVRMRLSVHTKLIVQA